MNDYQRDFTYDLVRYVDLNNFIPLVSDIISSLEQAIVISSNDDYWDEITDIINQYNMDKLVGINDKKRLQAEYGKVWQVATFMYHQIGERK